VLVQIRGRAVALIGLLSFLFIQRAYDDFYGRFGVNPTEVGIDIYVVAYRAAYAIFVNGLLVLLMVLATLEAIVVVWRLVTHQAGSGKTPWPSLNRRLRGWLSGYFSLYSARLIALFLVFAVFGLMYVLLITLPSNSLEDRIRGGESVETVTRITPLLWVRAERVRVDWIGPAETALPEGRPLTYLGSNEGIVIVYDLCEEMAVRVPAERVIVIPVDESVVDPNAC
jgi:hypothetical protein